MVQSQQHLPTVPLPIIHSHKEPRNGVDMKKMKEFLSSNVSKYCSMSSVSLREVGVRNILLSQTMKSAGS